MKKLTVIIIIIIALGSALSFVHAANVTLTDEEKLLVCQAVRSETKDAPYLAKIALSAVIINRLDNYGFPDSIHDIITDCGAFPKIDDPAISALTEEELYEEYLALNCVVKDGIDPTCGAVFYMRKDNVHLWEIHESFRVGDLIFGKPRRSLNQDS